jgi:ribosome-binding factor A
VGERIREELMDLLLRGAVKDPGAHGVIVHAVKVSGDLRHARVWVRVGEPTTDEARQRSALRALSRASGFLRRELGPRLGIRYTPELSFVWDESAEHAARVEELLHEIRTEHGGVVQDAASHEDASSEERDA